jgi:argininosuccinate lyase
MPQKKNPDAAELIRGKAGRSAGAFTSLLMMMKGLPMTYGKDMQEDKEPVFDAADNLQLCLAAMSGMIRDIKVNGDIMTAASGAGFTTATDLADWLVQKLDMPFRQAHHVTGALVKLAEDEGCGLEDLSLSQMQSVEAGISDEIYTVLGVQNSVASRMSFGGTAPVRVAEQITYWRSKLAGKVGGS